MSTKQKKTESSTSSTTTTPTNPEWSSSTTQALAGGVAGLQGHDPTSFFAGPSDLQSREFDFARQFGGQAQDWLSAAGATGLGLAGYDPQQVSASPVSAGQVTGARVADPMGVTGSKASKYISDYFNPYTEEVIDNGLADNERARQMAVLDTNAAASAASAFGGSRHGIADAERDVGYNKNALDFIGAQRSQGFNTALGAAQGDADRAQNADIFTASAVNQKGLADAGYGQQAALANQSAGLQAGLANQDASLRAGMANQSAGQAGAGLRLTSAQLLQNLGLGGYDALARSGATQQGYDQQQASAPLAVLQQLASTYGSLPLGLYQGNTQTGTATGNSTTNTGGLGAWASGLGGLLQGVGAVGEAFA